MISRGLHVQNGNTFADKAIEEMTGFGYNSSVPEHTAQNNKEVYGR